MMFVRHILFSTSCPLNHDERNRDTDVQLLLEFPIGGHVKYTACFIKLLSLVDSRHVTGLFCIIWIVWITVRYRKYENVFTFL